MKTKWSRSWVRSKQPRRQRKYRYNAPLHIKQKFVRAPLSEALRKEWKRRNARVVVGDKVKVMRGKFRKLEGEVTRVDLSRSRIFVRGIVRKRVAGSDVQVPLDPSKVMITELKTSDRTRAMIVNRGKTEKEGTGEDVKVK